MGGIFGIAWTDSSFPALPALRSMGEALTRDGSEPMSVKTGARFGAGAVVQFSRWQGVLEETDGLIVAADAEIYNRSELGAALEDLSPAKVIAALYRKLGRSWMEKISGTFAAAIWDPAEQRLMLVTDRFGIRPLVYAEREGFLAFASRLRSLTRLPAIERRIRPESILNYLFYSMVPSPDTVFEGVHKLPPGHFLLWQEGRTEIGCYWDLAFPEENRPRSFFASCLRTELERAVGRVLSDSGESGSVGCFLSGGTDSSTVTGMVGRLTGAAPRTFSIGFDVPGYNEIEYARAVVRHFGAEHHEYFVSAEDTARAIPAIVAEYDEPFGNASAVPTLYCARMAQANGIRMMLAGDGGDELFGGNERYARERVFDLYQEIPGFLRRGVIEPLLFSFPADAAVPLVDRARKYIRRAILPQPERFFSYNFLSEIPPGEVFSDDFLLAVGGKGALDVARRHFSVARAFGDLNRQLYCDLKLTITDNDLRKVTQMTEMAGLRVRYPMLDQRLASFSGTIPASLKVRRFALRYVFKQALRDFLPLEVIRKKKHGFGLPWSAWLRTDAGLQEIVHSALLDRASLERGYFRPGFLEKLFGGTLTDPTPYSGAVAWVFTMLELWHREQAASARAMRSE